MCIYLYSHIVTLVAQITYGIPFSTYAHIARPLNITFLLLELSSLHLMGFESSLINFTCPHFCPQLFIGSYYENLNLLFDYWLLPLEACGFWCIIEQSWSHKWLLHTRIKVWIFWMSNHLDGESFPHHPSVWLVFSQSQSNWFTVGKEETLSQLCNSLHFFF